MTADAGGVGAPRFDVVLRGYDRRQVDEHVARLQRVMSRMRADLEMVRSQPIPVVQGPPPGYGRPGPGQPGPGQPPPGAPRPPQRPRPDEPDMIGSFTDRMQSILQAAEEEAAEIRNKARAGARAETDSVRAELADLVRQREAVLHELTRLRGQLEGMLHAPTGRMAAAPRDGAPRDGANPRQSPGGPAAGAAQAAPKPAPGSERPAATGAPKPRPGPAPAGPPKPGQQSPGQHSPGPQQGVAQPRTSEPRTSEPGRPQPAPAQSSAAPVPAPSPTGSAQPASARPGPAPQGPSGHAASGPSRPSGQPSAGSKAPHSPQPSQPPTGQKPTGQNGSAPAGQQGGASRGSATVASPVPQGGDAGRPSDAAKQAKAAHRLPTGAYPAVAEQPSMRPRSEPEPEPADLFRPPAREAPAAKESSAKLGDVEATMKVGVVRPSSPSDATVMAPAVKPPEKKARPDAKGPDAKGPDPEGNGSTGTGAPDRSTSTSRSG